MGKKALFSRKFGKRTMWLAETTKTKALAKKGAHHLTGQGNQSRVVKIPKEFANELNPNYKYGIYSARPTGLSTVFFMLKE